MKERTDFDEPPLRQIDSEKEHLSCALSLRPSSECPSRRKSC